MNFSGAGVILFESAAAERQECGKAGKRRNENFTRVNASVV